MKKLLLICAIAALFAPSLEAKVHLPRAKASEEQIQSFDQSFFDVWGYGVEELHSLMVIQDGKVIYEKYATGHSADELHIMWSATKTFNATAVGFAAQDGLLSVDDPIVKFFGPEDLPEQPDPRLAKITVKHLLTMSSGFKDAPVNTMIRSNKEGNLVRIALSADFFAEPGEKFHYNSCDSYLLSVIVSKVTGLSSEDYLEQKLFKPLGIKKWHYDKCPLGYNCGGWGLYINTESFAKMGLFLLQKGVWNGKRLLNEEWINDMMKAQIYQKGVCNPNSDSECGYGYQMWNCTRPGASRLVGAWGQQCIVCPEKNAVIAFTAHCSNTQRLLNVIWKNVYDKL